MSDQAGADATRASLSVRRWLRQIGFASCRSPRRTSSCSGQATTCALRRNGADMQEWSESPLGPGGGMDLITQLAGLLLAVAKSG